MHPPWNQENNQSYPVRSNPVYVININTAKGAFENNKLRREKGQQKKEKSDQQGTLNEYVNVDITQNNSDQGGVSFGRVGSENNKPTCDKGHYKSKAKITN